MTITGKKHKLISVLAILMSFCVLMQVNAQYKVNGDASKDDCNCYTLTPSVNNKHGSVWNVNKISLNEPFDFRFDIYLGNIDIGGADGIAFALQNINTSVGAAGGGMGIMGISPSIAVTIDTYMNGTHHDPSYDHIAIQVNGVIDHNAPENIAGPVMAIKDEPDIEDGLWHTLRVTWDPTSTTLAAYVDEELRVSAVVDIVAEIFAGDTLSYWGFTGATGGDRNLQRFCTQNVAEFSVDTLSTSLCEGGTVAFVDSSYSFATIEEWHWDFGDGSTSTLQNPTHTYTAPGEYDASLYIIGRDGCQSELATYTILIHAYPEAEFTYEELCVGEEIQFQDASTISYGTIDEWSWDFGDGSTSTLQNPTHSYSTPGIYTVKLLVGSGGCKDSITHEVEVFPIPEADFLAEDVCFGFPMIFVNNSSIQGGGGGLSWYWDFGDGQTSTEQNPIHTYEYPDEFEVTLVVTSAEGCIDSITQEVEVFLNPPIEFSITSNCMGYTVVLEDETVGEIIGWEWDVDSDGTIDYTAPVVSHTYPDSGTYEITLTVTNINGCKSELTRSVTLGVTATAAFESSDACLGDSIYFKDLSSPVPEKWEWDFGDGQTSTEQNPSHYYSNPGTYDVHLKITAGGCEQEVTKTITVKPAPKASFTAADICYGDTIAFANTTTIPGGIDTVIWHWDFGDGSMSDVRDTTHFYAEPGTYEVILSAATASGCVDVDTQSVEVYAAPTSSFLIESNCLSYDVTLIDNSTGNIKSIGWDIDEDGNIDFDTTRLDHTFPGAGTYPISLYVVTEDGCKDDTTITITLGTMPNAEFEVQDVCLGDTAIFIDNSTPTPPAWHWDLGDGTKSTDQNPQHIYTNAGEYTVQLIVGSGNCADTMEHKITVFPTPDVSFTVDDVCYGTEVQFMNTTSTQGITVAEWQWDYGDGNVGNNRDGNHVYADSGIYEVILQGATDNACVDRDTQKVEVFPLPLASAIIEDSCQSYEVRFIDKSAGSIISREWDIGNDGSIDYNTSEFTHDFQAPGDYEVHLQVINAQGCIDDTVFQVSLYEGFTAAFDVQDACFGNWTHFFDRTEPAPDTWEWHFGDGDTSTAPNPVHYYADSGSYIVKLYVTSGECIDSIEKKIYINKSLKVDFTAEDVCVGEGMQFVNNSTDFESTIKEYQWDFGDGTMSVERAPLHIYDEPGTYQVSLRVTSDKNCVDSLTKEVVVHAAPLASFVVEDSCMSYAVELIGKTPGNILSWEWDIDGDGTVDLNGKNAAYTFQGPGTYPVSLRVRNENGCVDDTTMTIRLGVLPSIGFEATEVCLGELTRFTDLTEPAPDSWHWEFGDGNFSEEQNPTYTYTEAGDYQVLLVIEVAGCTDSLMQHVRVNPLPLVDFAGTDLIGCDSICAKLEDISTIASGEIVSRQWHFSDGSQKTGEEIVACYTGVNTAKHISVSLTVTSDKACANTVQKPDFISVYPSPTAAFTMNPPVADVHNTIQFINESQDGSAWEWRYGDGGAAYTRDGRHRYEEPGTYLVTLSVQNEWDCIDTASKSILIQPIYTYYVPSAFSPNGDGINDFFYPMGNGKQEQSIAIYDRWGALIYSGTEINSQWDGRFKGAKVLQGVYMYKITITDVKGEVHTYQGDVTVLE